MLKKERVKRAVTGSALILICSILVAQPVLAGCNQWACWSLAVTKIKILNDGNIWFLTDDPAGLLLIDHPSVDCTMGLSDDGGVNNPAMYIRAADPDREQKYMMLLTAFTTGAKVQVFPAEDPLTNYCSVGQLVLH